MQLTEDKADAILSDLYDMCYLGNSLCTNAATPREAIEDIRDAIFHLRQAAAILQKAKADLQAQGE